MKIKPEPYKVPWDVWFWLALGVILALCTIANASLQHWGRALDTGTLMCTDLFVAHLIYQLSKARHAAAVAEWSQDAYSLALIAARRRTHGGAR